MTVACQFCQEPFEAKRRTAKYCGASCRKRAQRSSAHSVAAELPDVADASGPRDDDARLIETTEAALIAAGALDTWQGQGALVLARDLARSRYGAGAHASLMKELRAVMAEIAPAKPKSEGTKLDGIRGQGAQRRTNPAGLHIVS